MTINTRLLTHTSAMNVPRNNPGAFSRSNVCSTANAVCQS